MPLKRLQIASTNVKKSTDDKQVFEVEGTVVAEFNSNKKLADDYKAIAEEKRLLLLDDGLDFLFEHNTGNPKSPATSIIVRDETGAEARITSQNKYSAADPDAAEAVFEDLLKKNKKLSINDFVQETVLASFDSSVFLDQKGIFSEKIYNAYFNAIQKVTSQLVQEKLLPVNTPSPLGSKKVVKPIKTFHEARWTHFPSVQAQRALFEIISNTVTVTPILPTN